MAPSSAGSAGLALLALSGAAAQASQAHPWGARLSSPLVAMLLGGLAAAAFPGALPPASASASAAAGLASAVSGTLVPLAACLALLEIDDSSGDSGVVGEGERPESEEKRKTGDERMDPTLAVSVSFAVASLATIAATLVAVSLCFCVRAASSPPQLPFFLSSILPSEAVLPRPLLIKVAACLCAS